MRPAREIGSFFASPPDSLLTSLPQQLPWEAASPPQYVETGRQALNVIARDLMKRGVKHIFLPEYVCESILAPLVATPLKISFLPVTNSMQMDLQALEKLEFAAFGEKCAILMLRYFGCARNQPFVERIAGLQEQGCLIVEDLTHSLLDPVLSTADYTFASLRKLLPVASGALFTGVNSDIEPKRPRSEITDAMWLNMDAKKEYLEDRSNDRYYFEGLRASTDALEGTLEAHAMDDRSFELLGHLPYASFAQSRQENFSTLARLLVTAKGVCIVNAKDMAVASHLVLQTRDRERVRMKLAERGVFCPVHWPRPGDLPPHIAWQNDLFSIPIDQRYAQDDMAYVGSVIRETVNCP